MLHCSVIAAQHSPPLATDPNALPRRLAHAIIGYGRSVTRRMNFSLRLFLIAAVALLPTTAVLFYNLWSLRQAEQQEVRDQAARIALLVALEVDQIIQGTDNLLRAVAAAPVVRRGDAAGCAEFLSSIVGELPQFASVAVADAGGFVRCAPPPLPEEVFVGDRSYFVEARETGGRVTGEFTEGRVSAKPSLPVAIPLAGEGAWAGGVAVASIDLKWLGARLKDRALPPGSAVTIADRKGRILAREPLPEDFVGTMIPDTFQHLVNADAPGTLELTSQDGTRRIVGYRPVDDLPAGLYVSAGISTEESFTALNQATLRGLLIALVSIVLALLLARSTSAAFVDRPFRQLVGTIDKWRRSDVTARTGMTEREGELGAVGKAIDEFMDELESARASRRKAEEQREMLLGELDHRVKNLLATVQSVARQSFSGPERTEAVNVFIQRLANMSDAHGILMRDEWQEAGIGRLVETAVEPFDSPDAPQVLRSGPDLTLNSRAALALSMALHELCTNATKYGALRAAEGRVDLTWSVLPDPGGGAATFRLVWRERGGPPVVAPASTGFGTRMIERALAGQIGGVASLDYRPEGLICVVTAPLSMVASTRTQSL